MAFFFLISFLRSIQLLMPKLAIMRDSIFSDAYSVLKVEFQVNSVKEGYLKQ